MANEQVAAVGRDYLARLPSSPDIYPQGLDLVHQAMLLVKFDAATYRAASFLDDRVLSAQSRGIWVRINDVSASVRAVHAPRPLHFIFHTGHVGSTLISRLLEEGGAALSLREPLPLRILAGAHDVLGKSESLISEVQFEALLELYLTLWARGYDWTRAVIVKATSSAGRLAAPLLTRRADARAICLNLKPEPYLATMLAGQSSPTDLRNHGAERIRRLMLMLGVDRLGPLYALSLGELAAMSWLTETLSQHKAALQFGARLVKVDFDDVLADVPQSLARVAAHFALPHDEAFATAVSRSSALATYSKAPDHAYSPALRAEILTEARSRHGAEIRKGIAWLEGIARAHAGASEVLQANS